MKPRNLPQAVLARLLDFQERVESVEAEAQAAEAEVARLRVLLSSRTSDVAPEDFVQARDGFEAVYRDMQAKRQRANMQGRLLDATKRWIEGLPVGTRLDPVPALAEGADLGQVRAELKELRENLRQLTSYPPASSDIEQRVRAHVAALARAATPMVRGYAAGQALHVTWPGGSDADRRNSNGFSDIDGNALLLFAALHPGELGGLIMRAVLAEQPLSQAEHREKVAELEAKIDIANYQLGSLVEQNGGEFDVELSPCHVLGVRIAVAEEAAAVA